MSPLGSIVGAEAFIHGFDVCRVKAETTQILQGAIAPPRPVNPSAPEIPLESIPGTYGDEAYGEIVICAVPPSVDGYEDRSPVSEVCRGTLLSNPFPTSDPAIPTFLAKFDKLSSDYLLFTHRNGSVFTVTPSTFYPERKEAVVSQFDSYDAIFTEDGMAFMGDAWGAGLGVEGKDPMRIGVERAAEVWFERKSSRIDDTEGRVKFENQ